MTDITELAQSLKAEDISSERMEWLKKLADMEYCASNPGHWLMNLKETNYLASLALQCLESNSALVEALEKAQGMEAYWKTQCRGITDHCEELQARIAELESRLNSADKLQDSAFRSGLQHGFSLGQTDDQKGYEQSMAAYSPDAGNKVEAE